MRLPQQTRSRVRTNNVIERPARRPISADVRELICAFALTVPPGPSQQKEKPNAAIAEETAARTPPAGRCRSRVVRAVCAQTFAKRWITAACFPSPRMRLPHKHVPPGETPSPGAGCLRNARRLRVVDRPTTYDGPQDMEILCADDYIRILAPLQ